MDELTPKPDPLRIALKALNLFALANFAFAYINPAIVRFSIFNHLVGDRLRSAA